MPENDNIMRHYYDPEIQDLMKKTSNALFGDCTLTECKSFITCDHRYRKPTERNDLRKCIEYKHHNS